MADSELEALSRRIPLLAYAVSAGYRLRPQERVAGLALLEHPTTRDAVAVAKTPDGAWIYASLAACAPPAPHESPEATRERLREGIARTVDKGGLVEFEQRRERLEGRADIAVEAVRERLQAWLERSAERGVLPPADVPPPRPASRGPDAPANERPSAPDVDARVALNTRRYASSPPPFGPHEAQMQDRLRRWDQAQRHLDETLGRPRPARLTRAVERDPPPRETPAAQSVDRAPSRDNPLNRRHYDGAPLGGDRGRRGGGPDHGR